MGNSKAFFSKRINPEYHKLRINVKSYFKSRFDQIINWFRIDHDGVILFDECQPSNTAVFVKILKDMLEKARFAYASVTEPLNQNMLGIC